MDTKGCECLPVNHKACGQARIGSEKEAGLKKVL